MSKEPGGCAGARADRVTDVVVGERDVAGWAQRAASQSRERRSRRGYGGSHRFCLGSGSAVVRTAGAGARSADQENEHQQSQLRQRPRRAVSGGGFCQIGSPSLAPRARLAGSVQLAAGGVVGGGASGVLGKGGGVAGAAVAVGRESLAAGATGAAAVADEGKAASARFSGNTVERAARRSSGEPSRCRSQMDRIMSSVTTRPGWLNFSAAFASDSSGQRSAWQRHLSRVQDAERARRDGRGSAYSSRDRAAPLRAAIPRAKDRSPHAAGRGWRCVLLCEESRARGAATREDCAAFEWPAGFNAGDRLPGLPSVMRHFLPAPEKGERTQPGAPDR